MATLTAAPHVTVRQIDHYRGADPVAYQGEHGPREFTPAAYEVSVDGEVIGSIARGCVYRETRGAGNFGATGRWQSVEWHAEWAGRDSRTHRSTRTSRIDAITEVLAYGARLGAGSVDADRYPLAAARPFAQTALVER